MSREKLIALLHYNPENGTFFWKAPHPKAGQKTGTPEPRGYIRISVIQLKGKQIHIGEFASAYEAHLAYLNKQRELHGEFSNQEASI